MYGIISSSLLLFFIPNVSRYEKIKGNIMSSHVVGVGTKMMFGDFYNGFCIRRGHTFIINHLHAHNTYLFP